MSLSTASLSSCECRAHAEWAAFEREQNALRAAFAERFAADAERLAAERDRRDTDRLLSRLTVEGMGAIPEDLAEKMIDRALRARRFAGSACALTRGQARQEAREVSYQYGQYMGYLKLLAAIDAATDESDEAPR